MGVAGTFSLKAWARAEPLLPAISIESKASASIALTPPLAALAALSAPISKADVFLPCDAPPPEAAPPAESALPALVGPPS